MTRSPRSEAELATSSARSRSAIRPRTTPAERRERKAAIDDPAVVLEAAARFLEVRPRSVAEVRRRLGQTGYRPELIDAAIERLTELGMLDDEQFARQWVESRDRAHPRGEHALIVELRQKGIDATTIAAILKERREFAVRWEDRPVADEAPADDNAAAHPDLAAARRLIERNRRALDRVPDPRMRRQKAYGLLARNGFDPETCREVAIEALAPAEDATVADEEPAPVED